MDTIITMLRALKNNDGLTLKKYAAINYKSGWQVADSGVEAVSIIEAATAIEKYNGSCGVWYNEGIYYIDHSYRVSTKKEALQIGREHNQISVLRWKGLKLVYC